MNKTLSKTITNRSRLRNKFIKNPTPENNTNYTKFRNCCTGLSTKEKNPIIITWTLNLLRITENSGKRLNLSFRKNTSVVKVLPLLKENI